MPDAILPSFRILIFPLGCILLEPSVDALERKLLFWSALERFIDEVRIRWVTRRIFFDTKAKWLLASYSISTGMSTDICISFMCRCVTANV